MNIYTIIAKELKEAISRSYDSEFYTTAVLDALHFLSDTIREKADVDGDGIALANLAFGGDSPKLRLNKLQTQSEKDEQKGFEQLVRGLYQGIRNPRSHDRIDDKKNTAEAIIIFINFVLETIGKSEPAFTIDNWLELVFDPDFVCTENYANRVAEKVPAKKRYDALINVYRRRNDADPKNVALIINKLCEVLNENQTNDFMKEVSRDLQAARNIAEIIVDGLGEERYILLNSESTISLILQVFPRGFWPKLDGIAKIRIEHKLIQSIKLGEYDNSTKSCGLGAFGTWAQGIMKYFEPENKHQLSDTFISKLTDTSSSRDYVLNFFVEELPNTLNGDGDDGFTKKRYFYAICDMVSKSSDMSINDYKAKLAALFPEDWGLTLRKKLGMPDELDADMPF